MKDEQLLKYFNNAATAEEKNEILSWVEESDKNAKHFGELYDLWILPQMAHTKNNGADNEAVVAAIKKQTEGRKKFRSVIYYSSAAIIAILLCVDILNRNIFKPDDAGNIKALPEIVNKVDNQLLTIYTPKGAKAYITLPDSSLVKLNSDTKIIYPAKFSGDIRDVYIDGEGYFQVEKDTIHPMIVRTSKGYNIKVVGTKFNVSSYSNESTSKTTLIEGCVNILEKRSNKEEVVSVLKKGESFVQQDNLTKNSYKNPDSSSEIAWTNDVLVFQDTPMKEALIRLERWHGTKFIVKSPKIYNIRLTAEYVNESIVQILEYIKFSSGINYSISNNTVTLSME